MKAFLQIANNDDAHSIHFFHTANPMAVDRILDSSSVTWEGHGEGPPDLRFLHFNDVYHIE